MNLCFRILFPLFCVFIFNSCSNEIDVLADYEESAAVYGLLDPNQSWQFVKINKVFINPGASAADVAKISDSLFFDSISAFIIEIETGKAIPLTKANIALKDSGTFANSPNYLYVTNESINPEFTYRFEMKLPNSDKSVKAFSNIVKTPFLQAPPFIPSMPKTVDIRYDTSSSPRLFNIQFQSSVNGIVYDAIFYFNYTEIDNFDTNIRINRTIEWKVIRNFRGTSDKGNETISRRIPGILFYELLLANIPVNPNVTRKFRPCELVLIGGNRELDTYIQASVPSIGIVQKQSDYTNIQNGVGLFASRNTLNIDNIGLSTIATSTLTDNPVFKPLGFVK